MNTFIHISDLHYGREIANLEDKLVKQLDNLKPDLIIISGDITQRATKQEFIKAKAFLNRLKFPYILIPGNHDLPVFRVLERFFNPWKNWCKYISTELEPLIEGDGYTAVGINTARRLGWYFDLSRGRISHQQIKRTEEIFKNNPDTNLRLLVAHHPFWLPKAYESRNLIGRRDEAIAALDKVGVDIILSGHIHLAYHKLYSGIIISHAGTTLSNRLLKNQPNSFNVMNGDRKNLSIENWEYREDSFAPVKKQSFHREKGEWYET
ncbi:metallophosphoesterase [uncultured Cocleimonas sp.]|uniref:metallophosphoesterase family protein n=1 Tax=uncultured Cocleimonas sp. TaxID=1051587 RepID=UPI00260E37BD|nr:metallophosphoesterase [uncultured Cocleimonas sp.]